MSRPAARVALACAALACGAALAHGQATVVFRTAPPDAALLDASAPGLDTALRPRAADNGGRAAELPAGTHEITLIAEGYRPARVTVAVPYGTGGTPLVVEAKLERASSVLRLARVIATGRRPKSVEFTPDGRYVVVAPLSGDAVELIDPRTGRLVASMAPPERWARSQGFVETAFPPGRGELWVSQMYTDLVHVFSLDDFSYLRSVPCGGSFPKVLLAHPDGRAFVSNWLSETVSVLSADGAERLGSMRAGSTPRGLALSPDGGTLYVANFGNGSIEAFDARSYARLPAPFGRAAAPRAGSAKRHLVVDPVRNRLYASDMGRGSVFAYDLAEDRQLAEIAIAPNAKTNTIALSPDGRWLYVSTRGPNNPVDYERKGPAFGELLVIDTDSLAIVERHWGGNQPTGLAVSPDGRLVVFTDFLDRRVEVYERFEALAHSLRRRTALRSIP